MRLRGVWEGWKELKPTFRMSRFPMFRLGFHGFSLVFHGFRLSLMSGGADGRPAAASRAAESCLRRREREQQREGEGLEAGQRQCHAPRASQMPCGRAFLRLVLQPSSLRQAMRCLELCSRAQVAVLPQGANTSLTGGSVPRDECDRPFAAGRNLRSGPYEAGKRLYNQYIRSIGMLSEIEARVV